MTSDQIASIGARFKAKNPTFASLSDFEAGKLYIRKFPDQAKAAVATGPAGRPLDTPRVIDPKKVRAAESQTEALGKIAGYEAARHGVIQAKSNTEHARTVLPLQHKLEEEILRSGVELTGEATRRKLAPATHELVRLEEEKVQTDVARARKLAGIDVAKNRLMERDRLRAYKREIKIDFEAALGMHMLQVEKIDFIAQKIAGLKALGVAPDDDRISFLEKLREQMERHLLEAPEQGQLGGADEKN